MALRSDSCGSGRDLQSRNIGWSSSRELELVWIWPWFGQLSTLSNNLSLSQKLECMRRGIKN